MPKLNTVRYYTENGYYHVYNRGVDKRQIFSRKKDYLRFESIVGYYLTATADMLLLSDDQLYWRSPLEKNEVRLVAYCLMPNHFHFLLQQETEAGITRFMRRVSGTYVQYFNKRYKRVGSLFEGKFKAVHIERDSYLLHLSRYIHRNPLANKSITSSNLNNYQYSSYRDYCKLQNRPWVSTDFLLGYFRSSFYSPNSTFNNYQQFVNYDDVSSDFLIRKLTLESD